MPTSNKGNFMMLTLKQRAALDVAKVADLVLLLTDASFGFEMEIFEFLNICQVQASFFV